MSLTHSPLVLLEVFPLIAAGLDLFLFLWKFWNKWSCFRSLGMKDSSCRHSVIAVLPITSNCIKALTRCPWEIVLFVWHRWFRSSMWFLFFWLFTPGLSWFLWGSWLFVLFSPIGVLVTQGGSSSLEILLDSKVWLLTWSCEKLWTPVVQ